MSCVSTLFLTRFSLGEILFRFFMNIDFILSYNALFILLVFSCRSFLFYAGVIFFAAIIYYFIFSLIYNSLSFFDIIGPVFFLTPSPILKIPNIGEVDFLCLCFFLAHSSSLSEHGLFLTFNNYAILTFWTLRSSSSCYAFSSRSLSCFALFLRLRIN